MSSESKGKKTSITKGDILNAQAAWGEGIINISAIHKRGGDYVGASKELIERLYAFRDGPVLFKPTFAKDKQFRPTFEEALSYFAATGVVAEDTGFAIKGWTAVRFENSNIIGLGKSAFAMGNYFFTKPDGGVDKVEYTFGYTLDDDGNVKIQLHHSSYHSSHHSNDLHLDPKETALVLIEYQNEFTTEGGKLHDAVKDCMAATGTLENSKKMLDVARDKGCTVVHVPISYAKGHTELSKSPYGILKGVVDGDAFVRGEWGSEICDIMKPLESEIVIRGKVGLCGFHSTNLDATLRRNKVRNVVIGGFLTNCCVESSMRTAYENGYQVYTLKDCCAATSVEGQNAAFEHTFGMFSTPSTSEEIISAL